MVRKKHKVAIAQDSLPLGDKITRKLQVMNAQGLHARPAAAIVKLLRCYQSLVSFTYKKQTVDAHSILGLLMLAAPQNAWIVVSAEGVDAEPVIKALELAFSRQFGELHCES